MRSVGISTDIESYATSGCAETLLGRNAQSSVSFTEWLAKLKYADWEAAADIQATYSSADLLGNGSSRVVFDIGGNKYRMIGKYAFGEKEVHLFILWIGTHAAYDKLCKEGEQFNVSAF